ncbi:APC2 [Lepeophtheirus salmonis]|uniref:APC2 n=1 Tax=Lepeophtheirus salmonis TaxID=72036 RepID=A0A7R8CLI4_LEPSM|nr:APC2 [Lepeophtheirus salmonis]CAF2858783.1 APC2 [Lepeophtheirus salmonis]
MDEAWADLEHYFIRNEWKKRGSLKGSTLELLRNSPQEFRDHLRDFFLSHVLYILRQRIIPQFAEQLRLDLHWAVDFIHDSISKDIQPFLKALDEAVGARKEVPVELWLKGTLHSQLSTEQKHLHTVYEFYFRAFRVFHFRQERSPSGSWDSRTITSNPVTDIVHKKIESHVLETCKGSFIISHIADLGKLVEKFLYENKLLHVGLNTVDILTAYIAAIRALMVLDPSGVLLEIVSEPVRKYLRSREDTVRCIVQSFDDNNSDLAEELERGQGLTSG